jgi:3-oxoacyl-[acyl-carrier protein] reductase
MTDMTAMLNDQVCLVTGASRGIGRAIASALGAQNAIVVGTATSEGGADAISAYLESGGIRGRGMVLDVTDGESVDSLVRAVSGEFGSPAVLVNNAGITRDNLMLRMKEEEWDAVIDTNLKSAFRMTRACLRPMTRARAGRIINIASVVGATGNPGQANYCSAKAGLVGFSKSLAQEVASRNITVNVIAPGFIATDMTGSLTDEQKSTILQRVPMGRLGSPEDVAMAVVYLASPMASYVTGSTLHVNGGMYMP